MSRIDVKKAAAAAVRYLNDIRSLIGNIKNIRLEEIEFAEAQGVWLVTLGYDAPCQPSGLDRFLKGGSVPVGDITAYERTYKIFPVDAETGEVQSMKIRSVS